MIFNNQVLIQSFNKYDVWNFTIIYGFYVIIINDFSPTTNILNRILTKSRTSVYKV
nr:MAG TPA: hypothetical protein [Caudoviricetes sp.]